MFSTDVIEAAGLWSYVLVFAITAGETSAFIGLLLPGEALILLAAALAGRGHLDPVLLSAAVIGGGITGDSLGYTLGHWYERRPSAERLRRRIQPGGGIDRARDFLLHRGGPAIFTGRFIGFVRSFLPFAAGAVGMPFRRFFLYSSTASVVWGTANVLAGYFLGSSAEKLFRTVGVAGAGAFAAVALAALVVVGIRRRRRTAVYADGPPPPGTKILGAVDPVSTTGDGERTVGGPAAARRRPPHRMRQRPAGHRRPTARDTAATPEGSVDPHDVPPQRTDLPATGLAPATPVSCAFCRIP